MGIRALNSSHEAPLLHGLLHNLHTGDPAEARSRWSPVVHPPLLGWRQNRVFFRRPRRAERVRAVPEIRAFHLVFMVVTGILRASNRVGSVDRLPLDEGEAVKSDVFAPYSRLARESLLLQNHVLGPLAQLVEQLTLNQLVVGSIPTRPTIFNPLRAILVSFHHSQ